MEYRRLGRSGLEVSLAGLGTNNFGRQIGEEAALTVIKKALDCGVTFFDTADNYDRGVSESVVGKALRGIRREVIIATKFSRPMGEGPLWRGTSRRYIRYAVEDSLRRLGTDYIDLYQVHLPDPQTPIEETLRALDDLVRHGLVRYIGCSMFSAAQIVEAQLTARMHHLVPFVSAQNQYNLLERHVQAEILPVCGRYGMSMLPFFPLASGFLTGKYRQGEPPPPGTRGASGPMADRVRRMQTEANYAVLARLEEFAKQRDHTLTDLAIGWLASQPIVASVIAGATRPEQVEANVRATSWRLDAEEMAEVAAIVSGRPG